MKYPAIAMATAMLLSGCGEEKKAPTPAPEPTPAVDYSFLNQKCDAASLEVNSYTNGISFAQTDGKLTIKVYPRGRMDHTPEVDTAGTKPQYSGPAYDAWLKRRDADRALVTANYPDQANYVLGKFTAKCPDIDLGKIREHIKVPAPAVGG